MVAADGVGGGPHAPARDGARGREAGERAVQRRGEASGRARRLRLRPGPAPAPRSPLSLRFRPSSPPLFSCLICW
eukprot:2669121-Rhodomonas_salina.1